jgi:hypothetical protein
MFTSYPLSFISILATWGFILFLFFLFIISYIHALLTHNRIYK